MGKKHRNKEANFLPKAQQLFAVRDREGNIITSGYSNKREARKARNQMRKDQDKEFFITPDKEHWKRVGLSNYLVE